MGKDWGKMASQATTAEYVMHQEASGTQPKVPQRRVYRAHKKVFDCMRQTMSSNVVEMVQ